MEQLVVDTGGGTGGKAEQGGGAEESRKEGEEKVEAQFGGAAKKIIGEEALPGAYCDDADGDPLQIPKRAKRRAGDVVPNTLLARVKRLYGGMIG